MAGSLGCSLMPPGDCELRVLKKRRDNGIQDGNVKSEVVVGDKM